MVLPGILVVFIFHYIPIYGLVISFKDFNVVKGIFDSPWVGLKWFITFFKNPYAPRLIRNTVLLSLFWLMWSFPLGIVFALLINELASTKFKKTVQTISYLPYFISTVIIIGMLKELTSYSGIINTFLMNIGIDPIGFFQNPKYFRSLYIISGIWQSLGWSTIIYLAAIAGVSAELYEACIVDGANRFQRVIHVTIPAILPTIMILLILNMGSILSSDVQKILLMYSEQTYETADVIGTYMYREGIMGSKYSYTTAVGLMLSAISFVFVFATNQISKKLTENSLW
jgi:putative aldouronate transport system permease protein